MLTQDEQKFPIYKFIFKWSREGVENDGNSFEVMFKEEPSEEKKQNIIDEHVKQINEKYENVVWSLTECTFKENESWVMRWFNHITYNLFETDDEVERSFRNFVDRKKLLNRKNGHYETEMNFDSKEPFYCLMGAEDYYRWKVCRCEHCLEQGKITVDH